MRNKKIIIGVVAAVVLLCIICGIFGVKVLIDKFGKKTGLIGKSELMDDWKYVASNQGVYEIKSGVNYGKTMLDAATSADATMRLSVGG